MTTPLANRRVVLSGRGGLDRLAVEEETLPGGPPPAGHVRVRVLATGVGATDLQMRKGYYIYAPPFPLVPGYEVVGTVDAVGEGASASAFRVGDRVAGLIVTGGAQDYLTLPATAFVRVEPGGDALPVDQVVALVLNYVTAYQAIQVAKGLLGGRDPATALVTTASGGVGLALIELLRLSGTRVLGTCSAKSFDAVREAGAEPLPDARSGKPVDETVRAVLPDGVDAAFDNVGGHFAIQSIRACRRGGAVVGVGFVGANDRNGAPSFWVGGLGIASYFVRAPLHGVRGGFYGITREFRRDPAAFARDFAALCKLLAEGKIRPRVAARLPLHDVAKGQEMLEKGGVVGKIVLAREV